MKVYLAAPIDLANNDIRVDFWREIARIQLEGNGWDVYCASNVYWPGAMPHADDVVYANQKALSESDGCLALLPPGVQTVGVPMEIDHARRNGIPVVVIIEGNSIQLKGLKVQTYRFAHLRQAITDLGLFMERR